MPLIPWIKSLFADKGHVFAVDWKTDNSILNFIKANIADNGKLKAQIANLPDEPETDGGIKFAPGLIDSLLGNSDNYEARVDELVALLQVIANTGNPASQLAFYNLLLSNDSIVGFVDAFLEKAGGLSLPVDPHLFEFANNLAFKTAHRNSVKFGLAMLGICGNKKVLTDIETLALHDEFTIYALVAIANIGDDVVARLWHLAKKVDGWGKIRVVDHLAQMDITDEVKDWLVYEGYKNSIMYDYLAYTCAVNGHLHVKLEAKRINTLLFTAATEIIEALLSDGPGEDISQYVYASITIQNFIGHAATHTSQVATFNVLNNIKEFLIHLQKDIADQTQNGWTEDNISNCLIDIFKIIKSKDWGVTAIAALKSSDNQLYWQGKQAAQILQIDIWDVIWDKLNNDPLNASLWYDAMELAGAPQVDMVIALAEQVLPLKAMATGPKDGPGWGPDFVKYQPLEYIIPFLKNYPGKGVQLMLTALQSPLTRNRYGAIAVLQQWKAENWPAIISKQVKLLQATEPNADLKVNIGRLLKGKELL